MKQKKLSIYTFIGARKQGFILSVILSLLGVAAEMVQLVLLIYLFIVSWQMTLVMFLTLCCVGMMRGFDEKCRKFYAAKGRTGIFVRCHLHSALYHAEKCADCHFG